MSSRSLFLVSVFLTPFSSPACLAPYGKHQFWDVHALTLDFCVNRWPQQGAWKWLFTFMYNLMATQRWSGLKNALLQTEHLQLCNMHEKSTRINGEESSSWTRNGITVLGSSGITGLGELSQNILQFSIICKLVTELTEIFKGSIESLELYKTQENHWRIEWVKSESWICT